jgi:hypothetical protein
MSERSASAPPPAPGPLCAAYAPLLPLLDAQALAPEQEKSLREHLANCAWCQNQRAAYTVVEAALRRQYAAIPSARPLTLEDIMRANHFDTQPAKTGRPAKRHELRTSTLPDLPELSDSSRGAHGEGRDQSRAKPWATLGAVAAAVLLVVLAASLFEGLRPHTPGGVPVSRLATPPPAPTCNANFANSPIRGAQTSVEGVPLPSITFVVPDDAANLHGYDLCSSGTVASVTAFLTTALPGSGWTKVASNAHCFYDDQCWTKGAAAISWHVDDPTDWRIAYHPTT